MRPALAAGLALVVGIAVGLGLGRGPLAPGADEGLTLVLERELDREREESVALRDQVDVLEARLADAAASEAARSAPATSSSTPLEGAGEGGASEADVVEGAQADAEAEAPDSPPGFDSARLAALGFHPSDIERLRRAWEALELEKLYLQNERARSTKRDGRHWMRMRGLENATLEELGVSDFDALLYASGARNRATVTGVFPDSPAESAGFVEGDEITAYDGKPIFRMHELKNETARCDLGTNVSVTVLREGAERRIWTPCGPLGVQLEMVNAPPR